MPPGAGSTSDGGIFISEVISMKRLILATVLIGLLSLAAIAQAAPAPPPMTLKVGDMAPDFTLPDTAGNKVKLSDFRGKNNVVLAFFVLAFTGG